ncbi:MAG TPA: glycoside hydrolase family 38 C-terminal domain-containing protein [Bryobacteraceae bacterium]|nr:glycoside hydrolase family 38 C-terminal domain-containing protein [Bryobacteraceae bacterium]
MRRRITIASLIASALPIAAIARMAADDASWPTDAKQYRIHLIGNAHIDAVWLWPWYEGMSVVNSTFRSSLQRMNETPGFTFSASSAQFYEWVSENDPVLLDQIRARVKQGRWDPVGGWWVEPDVNLPDGEALVRQGLYGQLTYKRLLGRMATTAYNPDSFGHPGTLPQILHLQGMDSYVFMRPMANEKALPAPLFWWQSPDGTRVLAYRIPIAYGDDRALNNRIQSILKDTKNLPHDFMAFYGAGDHGGGATKANIESIESMRKQTGAPTLVFSTPDNYFSEIRKQGMSNLPVVADDLQHHSVGCYTAESDMKKWNRTTEINLAAAEKIAAIGSSAWGANYPKTDFAAAWKRVLFLQFHDSLAGTALPEHYLKTAPQGYEYANSVAAQALYTTAEKLAWQVPTSDPDSEYLVAFNLQPWPVTANVEYDLHWKPGAAAQVEDEQGHPLPHQWIRPTTEVNDRMRLVAQVPLPAFGYRQIRIRKTDAGPVNSSLEANEHSLENGNLRLTVEPDGSIRLFDKIAGRDVFESGKSGCRGVVLNDPSDTWSHGVRAYTDEIGSFGNATAELLERGPLRARLRVHSSYGASTLTTEWLLYADAHCVEVRVTLDWHEHQKMLKFSFPLAVEQPRATYEIPFGNMVRETNGDENPGQRWIDVSGGQRGFALINDAKYGYSVNGNDMRLSVVRGAAFANHQPQVVTPENDPVWQDQGIQSFRMLLVPHSGTWQSARLPRLSENFLAPAPIIYQGIHPGNRPESQSFLQVDAPDIVISAIKRSEEGDDLILRCVETDGASVRASINLGFAGKQWTGNFRPYEIKTLRMSKETGAIKEVNVLEQ